MAYLRNCTSWHCNSPKLLGVSYDDMCLYGWKSPSRHLLFELSLKLGLVILRN